MNSCSPSEPLCVFITDDTPPDAFLEAKLMAGIRNDYRRLEK